MAVLRFRQAIVATLEVELHADPSVMPFGKGVAVAEGPFKPSEGLLREFGSLCVRDTSISEFEDTMSARVFLPNIEDYWPADATAHREVLGTILPVATSVEVG